MDSQYLNPLRVNRSYMGKRFECCSCERTMLYEDGYTYFFFNEEEVTYKAFWFCSYVCILAAAQCRAA